MTHIVLTEEQSGVIASAAGPVEVRDPQGNWLGQLDPSEAAVVSEAKRRLASGGQRLSAEQVEAHLRALEAEWQRTGGFDRDHMRAFLTRLRSGESG